jgi:uncharacterized protein YecT (DUF1311 family)
LIRIALALVAAVLAASPAAAQAGKQAADDSKTIRDCVKATISKDWETCVGRVADPCIENAKSTADHNACIDREQKIWDDILNDAYRRLRAKLDAGQQTKLRDMQRLWLAARRATCNFYLDYYQGTMALPMVAYCVDRETARRAVFLLAFLQDAEDK